jgi:hypothetical protein
MITTTLNRIREHSPCAAGWQKLLAHLGKTKADDEPVPFTTILESNGLDDALWCCRAEPQHASLWRHFAVDCAETVRHLMADPRSVQALDVARRYANGQATEAELSAARAAASDAASAAYDAASALLVTLLVPASAAWAAAYDAAYDAASAARTAAWAAAYDAAYDAASAARTAAWAAAYDGL